MGNCLVHEEKEAIKAERMDGKILKYRSPSAVHQALAGFPGDTLAYVHPVSSKLSSPSKVRSRHLYYHHQSRKMQMQNKGTGAVRIKLVISKQELKEILEKEGLTLEDMMSRVQKEPRDSPEREKETSMGWKPALESISEANDLS